MHATLATVLNEVAISLLQKGRMASPHVHTRPTKQSSAGTPVTHSRLEG